MVEFYLLTFPRFPLRKKEHKSYFGKNRTHDLRTSRCVGYILDHSDDEIGDKIVKSLPPCIVGWIGMVGIIGVTGIRRGGDKYP